MQERFESKVEMLETTPVTGNHEREQLSNNMKVKMPCSPTHFGTTGEKCTSHYLSLQNRAQ